MKNIHTGREGRKGFAKDAKETFTMFPGFFRALRVVFASFASGFQTAMP